ncbi:hypothetical protein THAOC_04177 [Thalassiosira oceanica]|uniref:Transmembrane protein n=1 Tax=Thalassiosira oceanica TaxID=159749 RepID=K0TAP3_THAOC|nr:hypothetical protein THAOC_04177 [Thalassiosira oceanica]|eukprot:EJK74159.1 hypothetical protein THAOC_04177 [Thalassiosira oceanica]
MGSEGEITEPLLVSNSAVEAVLSDVAPMGSEGEITEPLLVSNSAVEALLSDVAQQHEEDLHGTVTSNENGDQQMKEPNHVEEQDEDLRETMKSNRETARRAGLLDRLHVTNRMEVTLRIAFSLAVTSVMSLGSFPNAIPPSQTVVIGAAASTFTMISPTLIFSIGAMVFPGMVMTVCVAMLVSTLLLIAAAVGGSNAYIICFTLVALIIAGITFDKSFGTTSSLLITFTALNTMGFVPVAEEGGIPFVLSLWSESGTTNPGAVFRNGLIGMMWLSLAISSARLIPPARTARAFLTRVFLPKVLTDVATFIRLIMQQHVDGEEDEEADDSDEVAKSLDAEEIDDVVSKVVQDGTLTITGGIANLTAFEPRLTRTLCQGGTLIDIVALANSLTDTVGALVLSSLALRALIRAGFNEMLSEGLQDAYLTAADTLDACATSLANLTPLASTSIGSEDNDDEMSRQEVYDPIRLKSSALKLERLTNFWVANITSPATTRDHHIDDKTLKPSCSKSITPWLKGGGLGLLMGIIGTIRTAFSATTWRRIVYSPYYDLPKFTWSVKYGLGVSVIVLLTLYTDFATFELETSDPFAGAFFSG